MLLSETFDLERRLFDTITNSLLTMLFHKLQDVLGNFLWVRRAQKMLSAFYNFETRIG